MDKNDLKNIVILKNLPSNIVDEAIVILKPNKKIKNIEVLDKKNNKKFTSVPIENNKHVIKEAEMLVNNYIYELEKEDKRENTENILNEKYKRLKNYSLFSSLILLMSIILHFV